MFELGPPVMLDAATLKTMKISRFERVGFIFVSNRPKRTRESGAGAPALPGDRCLAVSAGSQSLATQA